MNEVGDDTRTIEFLEVDIAIMLEAPAAHYFL